MSEQRRDDTTLDRVQARIDHDRANESLEQRAKREMEDRNRNAWKQPTTSANAREDEAEHNDASEGSAYQRMVERNRVAWKGSK